MYVTVSRRHNPMAANIVLRMRKNRPDPDYNPLLSVFPPPFPPSTAPADYPPAL